MRKDYIIRGSAVILAVFTVLSVVFAIINFQKDGQFSAPDDGVWWVEHNGGLFAKRVVAGGPGDKAGIKEGDQLIAVSDELNSKPADKLLPRNNKEQPKLKPFSTVAQLERRLYAIGVWSKADYVLDRQGSRMGASVILTPTDRSLYLGERLIGLIYLGIGIYVLFRPRNPRTSTSFVWFLLFFTPSITRES
jgi:hypothetical protein